MLILHDFTTYTLQFPSFGFLLKWYCSCWCRAITSAGSNLSRIWLAPGHAPGQKLSEKERYEKALAPDWPDVHIRSLA